MKDSFLIGRRFDIDVGSVVAECSASLHGDLDAAQGETASGAAAKQQSSPLRYDQQRPFVGQFDWRQ